jgi:hypothetical protein
MPRIEITLCILSARFTEGLVPIMDLRLRNRPDLASQINGASRSSPTASTNSVAADC